MYYVNQHFRLNPSPDRVLMPFLNKFMRRTNGAQFLFLALTKAMKKFCRVPIRKAQLQTEELLNIIRHSWLVVPIKLIRHRRKARSNTVEATNKWFNCRDDQSNKSEETSFSGHPKQTKSLVLYTFPRQYVNQYCPCSENLSWDGPALHTVTLSIPVG